MLGKLKNDRLVDDIFIARLEKNGFKTYYGDFEYWQNVRYVQVGKKEIYLSEAGISNGTSYIKKRYRNDVIEEIIRAIIDQKNVLKRENKLVEIFFQTMAE